MSSIFTPSAIATSVCPTDIIGTPSETPTVEGFPSVCSIATLQRTTSEPPMTNSDSLYPWNAEEGGTEFAQAKKEETQESGARSVVTGTLLGIGAFVAVHLIHTAYWKQKWLGERDNEEGQWTAEEYAEGERREREALKLPPISQGNEEENEANTRLKLD